LQLNELLDMGGGSVTGVALRDLAGHTQLKYLLLRNNQAIDDAGLAALSPLVELRELFLTNTGITDAGLVHLRTLTQLRRLGIAENYGITGAGLSSLTELQALETLEMGKTRVQAESLPSLAQFPNLQVLNLDSTG